MSELAQHLPAAEGYGSAKAEGATVQVQAENETKPAATPIAVRAASVAFLVFGFVLGLLLRTEAMEWIAHWNITKGHFCSSSDCVGNQGAYRVSFSLFLFFGVHVLMSSKYNLCMEPAQRVAFNNSRFLFKLIAYIPILLLCFVIPNNFFVVYAWITLFLSIFFLIGQLLVLLEFAYAWNQSWAAREEQRFQVGLLIMTAVLFLGSLVVIGFQYKWFGADAECQTGRAFVTVTLIAMVIYTFLSVWASRGSILPAGVMFFYTTWTCFSALDGGVPRGTCNTIESTSITELVGAAVITAITLGYSVFSAGGSRDAFTLGTADDETPEDAEAANYTFFHIMMVLASGYLAMLLTGWEVTGSAPGSNLQSIKGGAAPMWSKFSSELVCILLYVWSLAAPALFPDRYFA